ncbi:Primosomal protein N' [Providencia rustigianii]|nr:Primosomal protein N' [Providencia rustigianii]
MIRSEDHNNQDARNFLHNVRQYISQHPQSDSRLWILGPAPSIQAKRGGRFRWQLLLQHPSRAYLQQFMAQLLPELLKQPESRKVKWNIDVDPTDG